MSSVGFGSYAGLEYYAPAETGSVTLEPSLFIGQLLLPLIPRNEMLIVVKHLPANPVKFSADGLTYEGTHRWEYEFRFFGLRVDYPPK
jgi:hypothetical protein